MTSIWIGEVGDVLQRPAEHQAQHEEQHARLRCRAWRWAPRRQGEERRARREDVDAVARLRGAAEDVQQDGRQHAAGGLERAERAFLADQAS